MKVNDKKYPLIMTEEYWANTQLSVVRYTGHIQFMGHRYVIVNQNGIDIFALSIKAEKEGREKAIEPGEPCDLVLDKLIPAYHKLGRDRIIKLVKEGKSEKEIKAIAFPKKKKVDKK